jgi:hypothetical protein
MSRCRIKGRENTTLAGRTHKVKRIKLATQGVLGGLVLLAGTNIHAGLPSPPPIDELTAFYEATGGDNWHRNDHWLDEEIHHCDWYGIICHDDIVPRGIHSIRLPGQQPDR